MGGDTSSDDVIVVLCNTDGAESAAAIARELVGGGLVACVNVVAGVRSFYRWKGEVSEDSEHLMVIKTRRSLFEQVRQCIRGLHPYDWPEIIALPLAAGDAGYLDWVRECTAKVTS
jgi:periplasmic divalent cation tolerance protein